MPKRFVAVGMPAEIKFSLETTDLDEDRVWAEQPPSSSTTP
ncbi:hypothetical protein [Bradyrhizobium sp. ORS 285]|nr:hypothetical protein [Bradyrhizobium sp. ORS 285]